jgi:hypothetical protein
MIRKNQADLLAALKKDEGYNFRDFELVSEGDFLPSDADWNYKDIPHLKNVHNLVEGFPAYAGDDFIGSIFVQKMFGGLIKIPLSVFNYQSAKNEQTYFTVLFFFILIIRTNYEQIGELRTKVTTRYAIGTRGIMKLFLPLIFPLMKWSIKKNYDDLMTADIPMRARRGVLRKMGYSFAGDQKDYSFIETCNIMESNVIAPLSLEKSTFMPFKNILSDLEKQNPTLYGEADLLGFQAYKIGDKIKFFPRTCIHEGACLDRQKSNDNSVRCPWHGRLHKALLEVNFADKKIKAVRIEIVDGVPMMMIDEVM